MGSSIRKHLEAAGHDVHVLLLTTGVSSGALGPSGLTPEQFVAARDDEYMRALRRLGVRYPNIHYAQDRPVDDGLTVESAEAQILAWLDGRTDVWLKSYSWRPSPGRHQHHVDTGQACLNLLGAGVVANLRCYVEPWALAAFKNTHAGVSVSVESAAAPAVVQAALAEYKAHDNAGGKYGIGYLSVKSYFDQAIADPRNHYHVP